MTKIKQYELDSTIHEDDKVIGTDGNPGVDLGRTKNFTIAALTAYLNTALEVDNMVGGSGTLNTIPMWTPDGTTLGNSIITTDPSLPLATDGIVVNGKFRVEVPTGTNAFNVSNEVVSYINARFNAGIIDSNSSLGTAGQALLSTSTATEWGTFYIGYADQSGDFDIKFGYNDGVTNTTTHAVRVYAGSGITLTDNFPLGFSISADNQIPADNVTGAGTLNTVPLWTPDGQTIGDSIMVQTEVAPDTFVLDIGTTRIAEGSLTADIFYGTSIYTTNLNGINGGTVTLNGDTILGNAGTDTITVNGEVSLLGAVKDSTSTLGASGQILISDASGLVSWGDETTYTYSSSQDGSDVILQLTDGVTPQEISLLAGTNITLTDNGNNDITIDGAGDTTYSVSSQQAASDVEIILSGSDTTESEVTLVAGNSISLTDDGNNNITIAATGGAANTTYSLTNTRTATSTRLDLVGSDATIYPYTFAAGTGLSFDQTVNNKTTINLDIADVVSGTGTLNTIPMWTPDGTQLGDSYITTDTTGSPFTTISVPLYVGTGGNGTVYVQNVFAGDGGFVTLNGNTVLGNASTDIVSVNGTTTFNANVTLGNTSAQDLTVNAVTVFESSARFADQLVDTNGASGSSGQVLTSTGTGVDWVNVSDLTDNVTGTGTANYGALWTDADTLGVALWRQTANNSIGIGLNASSVGQESIAFNGSESNGDFSTAFAYESITDGEFSVTLGKGGYSAGDHSTAIGYKGISLGECSISGGHSSSAGGDGAVALGHNASAGNYGVAKATSTFPNDQTTFDIYGIVGTVAVGTFLRYGPGFDNADPRIEVTQFTDLGNGAATITIASGIRPIAGELLVFEELTPQRDDHQGGVALGNDAFSLGQGAVALGQDAVASADFAVAIGRTANTSTTDSIALGGGSTKILIEALVNASSYADDTAAAAGGVAIGELYRNGNVVQIRLT